MIATERAPGAAMTRPYSAGEARADIVKAWETHADTLTAFHHLTYHQRHTWNTTRFEGVPVLKTPQDLWTYHEWIWLLKPDVIIETGTAHGGSALYFARQLDRLGRGRVVTFDVEAHPDRPRHDRIQYAVGSSVDRAFVQSVLQPDDGQQCMVVLDSRHDTEHVLAELAIFAPLVTRGQLLVVEDTNLTGPSEALEQWLPDHPEFQRELLCERWLMTFHPGGWLRRVG